MAGRTSGVAFAAFGVSLWALTLAGIVPATPEANGVVGVTGYALVGALAVLTGVVWFRRPPNAGVVPESQSAE